MHSLDYPSPNVNFTKPPRNSRQCLPASLKHNLVIIPCFKKKKRSFKPTYLISKLSKLSPQKAQRPQSPGSNVPPSTHPTAPAARSAATRNKSLLIFTWARASTVRCLAIGRSPSPALLFLAAAAAAISLLLPRSARTTIVPVPVTMIVTATSSVSSGRLAA